MTDATIKAAAKVRLFHHAPSTARASACVPLTMSMIANHPPSAWSYVQRLEIALTLSRQPDPGTLRSPGERWRHWPEVRQAGDDLVECEI